MYKVASIALASLAMISSAYGVQHDIFIAGGQSNANVNWRTAIQSTLAASGKFTNPELAVSAYDGDPLWKWYEGGRGGHYLSDFYNPAAATQATLEQRVNTLAAAGDTYTIRGFFWFQGESDASGGGQINLYKSSFEGMMSTLKSDLGISYNIPVEMALIWYGDAGHTATQIANRDALRLIQMSIPGDYPNSGYADSFTYTRGPDNLHLISSESTRLGNTMAAQLIATVPEPASLAIFGLLSAGVLLRRSRVRN